MFYYDFMSYCISKFKEYNGLTDEDFLPINEVVDIVEGFKIRPAITFGNNMDYSNIRREEDWILTFQIFLKHGEYLDIREKADELKRTLIKHCCSVKINDVSFTTDEINLTSSFETDYSSMSINVNVNSKEVI